MGSSFVLLALVAMASCYGCRAVGGHAHMVYVLVPIGFASFRGTLWVGDVAMRRNVVILASTASQWFYDVYVSWLPPGMEISSYTATESRERRVSYIGPFSMLQCLFALWPIIGVHGSSWQEIYIYSNDYPGEAGATIHVRHSIFPRHWWKRIVYSIQNGDEFFFSFWKIYAPPVVTFAGGVNTKDYIMVAEHAMGPLTPMMPTVANQTVRDSMATMYLDSVGTTIPVHFKFVAMLGRLYDEDWSIGGPMSRM
jgi:hypothetical protein